MCKLKRKRFDKKVEKYWLNDLWYKIISLYLRSILLDGLIWTP